MIWDLKKTVKYKDEAVHQLHNYTLDFVDSTFFQIKKVSLFECRYT